MADRGETASDSNVTRRKWLLIDVDPVRIADVSATVEEKAEALVTIEAVRAHLHAAGWPESILADSGNGYHALYRIDLPADDGGIVQRCLKALAARFDSTAVSIDTSVTTVIRRDRGEIFRSSARREMKAGENIVSHY